MRCLAPLVLLAVGITSAAEPATALDAAVMKTLFGPQFVQLDAAPRDVVTDADQRDQLLSDLLGCPTRDDGADDFAIADCQKRSAALRASKEPLYLELLKSATPQNLKYDFKRRGWELTFTDDLGTYEISLSAWKPSIPNTIQPKKCDDGRSGVCYPMELPRTFRSLTLFIPMNEPDARAWRDTWALDNAGNEAWLSFLVSVRRGTQWTKNYTRVADGTSMRHRGLLVSFHAMRVKFGDLSVSVRPGERSWAFPAWYAAP